MRSQKERERRVMRLVSFEGIKEGRKDGGERCR